MVTRQDKDNSPMTSSQDVRYVNPRWALFGGLIAAVVALITYAISGQVYFAGEARSRIQEMIPTMQTLSLAVMTRDSSNTSVTLACWQPAQL